MPPLKLATARATAHFPHQAVRPQGRAASSTHTARVPLAATMARLRALAFGLALAALPALASAYTGSTWVVASDSITQDGAINMNCKVRNMPDVNA